MTEYLPTLKQDIVNRPVNALGLSKVVIRPDSGDPVKIICGDPDAATEYERKGSIECLWDIFGGTINSKGYKELDSHIGVVNGEFREIYKDPKTDSGTKKSARGLLRVEKKGSEYVLYDQQTDKQEKEGCLATVFVDGKLIKEHNLPAIRERLSTQS